MSSILWAAVSSVAWGSADFFAKIASDRLGAATTLFWGNALSIVFLGIGVLVAGPIPAAGGATWGLAAALGLSNTLAILMLYRSFEIGTLSLVSPIASSFPAVSLLLAVLFLHEVWTGPKLVGIALILVGTIVASWVRPSLGAPQAGLSRGVPEAVVASLVMGVTMFGLVRVAPVLGSLLSTWVLRVVAAVALLLGAMAMRRPLKKVPRDLWGVVAANCGFDTIAFVAYNQAVKGGEVGLAAPISGSFALTTLVLARVILKDRLAYYQWAGIAAVLAGIGLVSWPS